MSRENSRKLRRLVELSVRGAAQPRHLAGCYGEVITAERLPERLPIEECSIRQNVLESRRS